MLEWLLYGYAVCVGCCLFKLLEDVLLAHKGCLYLTWGGLVGMMFLSFIPLVNLVGVGEVLEDLFYKVVDLLDKPLFKR